MHRYFVLSAIEHFSGFDEIMVPNRIRAVLGLHAISEFKHDDTPKAKNTNAYEINFRNIVIHPKYKCKRPDNDIGILDDQYVHGRRSSLFCFVYSLFRFSVYFFLYSKALLEASEPIVFSNAVQPICISSTSIAKNKTYVNEAALISGWGNLMEEFAVGRFATRSNRNHSGNTKSSSKSHRFDGTCLLRSINVSLQF